MTSVTSRGKYDDDDDDDLKHLTQEELDELNDTIDDPDVSTLSDSNILVAKGSRLRGMSTKPITIIFSRDSS